MSVVFIECYCLVGIILSQKGVNIETAGQFCILMFKSLSKVHFYALRIYHYEVVEGGRFHDIDAKLAFQGKCTENIKSEAWSSLMEHCYTH